MTSRSGIAFARNLRREQTPAERELWKRLRSRELDGFKFRRQFPIDRYVADFVCLDAKLVVELDGSQHADSLNYDAERTRALEANGFHVLRFWNYQVMKHSGAVLETIRLALHRIY